MIENNIPMLGTTTIYEFIHQENNLKNCTDGGIGGSNLLIFKFAHLLIILYFCTFKLQLH